MVEYVRFGDLYDIPSSNGLSRPSAVRGSGYKMVNMGELFANSIINDIPMERVQMSDKELSKFLLEPGDLLFARQSLVAEGAGKCSYVNSLAEPTTFESHLIRVRLNPKKALSRFYFYLFQLANNPIKSIVNQCAQAGIRGSELVRVKVPCPSLPTQQKIASILSAYDSQIENNQKRIKLLEQMAENLYKEWFVRFRFPGYKTAEFEGGLPKGWNSQACHNKKPKGWKYGELKNLGSFARGKNITSTEMIEGEVPVISAGLEPSGYHNAANVSGPCLTISSSGANAGYLKYNLTDIWAADCSFYNSPDNIWFVYSALKYLQPVISNMQCGSAQPHVYPKDVNRLCVVLPPITLVKQFNKQCQVIFDEILNLNNQIKHLTTQRDLLLPRLMSGKLSI